MNARTQKNPVRTMVVRMLAGAVVGAAAMALFLALFGDTLKSVDEPGVVLASMAGVIYVVTGLAIGVGLASPRLGARFLNVEDADELREEGGKLKPAALVMVLTGAFLLVLVLSSIDAGLSRELTLVVSLALLATIIIASWLATKRYDELTRQLGLEAAALFLQMFMLLIGTWVALAHLGYVEWLTPLATIAIFTLVQLVASFIVVGRHGMLTPR